jgi:hypothetical protein
MKKIAKTTKPQRTLTLTLTQPDLAAVLGGTEGVIVVQNILHSGVGGTGNDPSGSHRTPM